MSDVKNVSKKRTFLSAKGRDYSHVNSNPIIKSIIQTLVMLIDIAVLVVLIWNLFAYLIPYGSWINVVSGNSMYPTMRDKQIIFTDMQPVERGDIVTAYFPKQAIAEKPNKNGAIMVKRVIGIPGDTVRIDEFGSIYVNNVLVNENYVSNEAIAFTYVDGGCNSIRLSYDEYFVIGDNRGVSYDSRYFGPIKSYDLIYKQSVKPTINFYIKLFLVLIMFLLDVFLYFLIELILMECADYLLSKLMSNKCEKRNKEEIYMSIKSIADGTYSINDKKNITTDNKQNK